MANVIDLVLIYLFFGIFFFSLTHLLITVSEFGLYLKLERAHKRTCTLSGGQSNSKST